MPEKMPADFREASEALLGALRKEEDAVKEGYVFTFGPVEVTTSKGNKLTVENISWFANDGRSSIDGTKARLVLVAADSADGKIVGLRLSDIQDGRYMTNEQREISMTQNIPGEILTRARGEGIATALDTAFVEVVGRIAQDSEKLVPWYHQFNWNVENGNQKRIDERPANRLDEDAALTQQDRAGEQKRWQSLYGEEGKFGLHKTGEYDYTKIIDPAADDDISHARGKVTLDLYHDIIKKLEECSA